MRAAHYLLVVASLQLLGCAGQRIPASGGVAEPVGLDFFLSPEQYRGKTVRIPDLRATVVDPLKPLTFQVRLDPRYEVVVADNRSVARIEGLRPGEVVTALVRCTEGRLDRGNLLVGIERFRPPPALP